MKKEEAAAFKAHKAHFGPISKGLKDYVENHVLLYSRYLFTKSVMRVQYAYCTHCRKQHRPEEPLKHNSKATCPECKSTCVVKKSHVGRKFMKDSVYVVYYEKSIIDPSVITAKGFFVRRDYTGDYKEVTTLYRPSCSYVFEMGGKSTMFCTGYWDEHEWYPRKNIVSEYSFYKNGTPCYTSIDSIKEAVADTPFQYSTWEHYSDGNDMTKFFGLYSKYPCIEFLTKMGYQYFVHAKLEGRRTYDAIKWSGKTVDAVLRLSKKDFKQFKEWKPRITESDETGALTLRLYQLTLKDRNRPPLDELKAIASAVMGIFLGMKPMFKYQNVRACAAYIERQKRKNSRVFGSRANVVSMWKDYMQQCEALGLDLTRNEVVFPHNLYTAHESTTSQVKIKISEIEAQRIAKRVAELEQYRFEMDGYIIRPALSGDEIIKEGKALRHCVGGYAERHAKGETNIFMLRKVADPDQPYFTLELKDGKIKQAYGYQHQQPTGDLKALIETFKKLKVEKRSGQKINKRKEAVAV
ncbi:PcfJ domain-containing protein [Paenibacillus tyrfis]|uniref:PcfJ-like protein n=1 Tax=Paenibacillus tyrfis TaxID=1501230 RepID=A0A081P4D2_9BACL|nr:PcfJ domain-containing protein [Paenibacillus tyrfis]KEQ25555.1 hypothetical protein ET33_02200 [Paenibacillus tyrfis]